MVYVPTAFPDGVGEAWWLALERIISRERRINLMMDRQQRHFAVGTVEEKYELYAYLSNWLRRLAPQELSAAIPSICQRCRARLRWTGVI